MRSGRVLVLGTWLISAALLGIPVRCSTAQANDHRVGKHNRVDSSTGRVISVFGIRTPPSTRQAEQIAREFLATNREHFHLKSGLNDLRVDSVVKSVGGQHVVFQQFHQGVPVRGGIIKINLRPDNSITSVYSHYVEKPRVVTTPRIDEYAAGALAENRLQKTKHGSSSPEASLKVHRDKGGQDHLVWEVYVEDVPPEMSNHRVIVDAQSGELLETEELIAHTGSGLVFDPDPRTALENSSLTDNGDADFFSSGDSTVVYKSVDLLGLDGPDGLGNYRLRGTYAFSRDFDPNDPGEVDPGFSPRTSATTTFNFDRDDPGFEEVTIYYLFDTTQRYLQSLGFTNLVNRSLRFDAHNYTCEGAGYTYHASNPNQDRVTFGDGGPVASFVYAAGCSTAGVDMGEDPVVIVHEYCHGIFYDVVSGARTNTLSADMKRVNEGFSDYMGGSHRRSTPPGDEFLPDYLALWTLHTIYSPGTRPERARKFWPDLMFPDDNDDTVFESITYPHYPGGSLWASTLMDVELALNSRDIATTLAITALDQLTYDDLMEDAARELLQADFDIYSGTHAPTIIRVLANRGFLPKVSGSISSNTTWDTHVYVAGDLEIEDGATLNIDDGLIVAMSTEDELADGADEEKVEFVVRGTLNVNGTSVAPIRFVSSDTAGSEGDWWGITVPSIDGGICNFTHAHLQHSDFGLTIGSNSAIVIGSSHFSDNALFDIRIGYGATNTLVSNDTITVEGGTGIEAHDGAGIDSCLVVGNSETTNCILLPASSGSPPLIGNVVTGASSGSAILIQAGSSTLTQNDISNSKYGVQVISGSSVVDPRIGTTSSTSDNFIHDNTTGILVTCSGPGSCPSGCSSIPIIRNNQIYDNTYGVYANKSVGFDLGTSTQDGKNSLYNMSAYCIYNKSSSCGTVIAIGNWFGNEDCMDYVTCTSGSVSISPYLCSQPSSFKGPPVVPVPTSDVATFRLLGMGPNPMTFGSSLAFELIGNEATIGVRVFDLAGRLVREFPERKFSPGRSAISWSGDTDEGRQVANGIYFARVSVDGKARGVERVMVAR